MPRYFGLCALCFLHHTISTHTKPPPNWKEREGREGGETGRRSAAPKGRARALDGFLTQPYPLHIRNERVGPGCNVEENNFRYTPRDTSSACIIKQGLVQATHRVYFRSRGEID